MIRLIKRIALSRFCDIIYNIDIVEEGYTMLHYISHIKDTDMQHLHQ